MLFQEGGGFGVENILHFIEFNIPFLTEKHNLKVSTILKVILKLSKDFCNQYLHISDY